MLSSRQQQIPCEHKEKRVKSQRIRSNSYMDLEDMMNEFLEDREQVSEKSMLE